MLFLRCVDSLSQVEPEPQDANYHKNVSNRPQNVIIDVKEAKVCRKKKVNGTVFYINCEIVKINTDQQNPSW